MLLSNRRVLAFKKETSEGAAVALAAADAKLLVYDVRYKPGTQVTPRNPTANTLSHRTGKRGKNWCEVSFKFELKGEDSTADSVPTWGPLMEAAGLKQAVNTGVSVTWEPTDTLATFADVPSLTMSVYIDGIVRTIRGARCTSLVITGEVGGTLTATVTFKGVGVSPGDTAAAILAPTYPTALPEVLGQWVCTLDAVNYNGTKVELNVGLKTAERYDPTMEYGCKSIAVTNFEPTMTLDPELELPATKGYFNEMLAETIVDFKGEVGTGVTGHVVTIDANRIQWEGVDDSDRDDLATAGLKARVLGPEGGGVPFTITKK